MRIEDTVKMMVAKAQLAGVDEPGNLPFLLQPRERTERAVLLVHGFTATPWEMRPLAAYLADHGYAVLAVRLSGHGTTPEALARCRRQAWHDDVAAGREALSGTYHRVYGVGVSTGALLLLHAALHGGLSGLALVSPYLRLQHRLAPWAGLLRWLIPYQKVDHAATVASHYYGRRPLAGVAELNRLVAELEPRLRMVQTPTLVLGGAGDETIDIASTRELFERLGAADKESHRFGADAPHVLCGAESPVRDATLERIGAFFTRLEEGAAQVS